MDVLGGGGGAGGILGVCSDEVSRTSTKSVNVSNTTNSTIVFFTWSPLGPTHQKGEHEKDSKIELSTLYTYNLLIVCMGHAFKFSPHQGCGV